MKRWKVESRERAHSASLTSVCPAVSIWTPPPCPLHMYGGVLALAFPLPSPCSSCTLPPENASRDPCRPPSQPVRLSTCQAFPGKLGLHPLDPVPPPWSRMAWHGSTAAAHPTPHCGVCQLQEEEGPSVCCQEKSGPCGSQHLVRVLGRPGRKRDQLIHICFSRLEYKWGDGRINLFKNVIS